MSRIWKNIVEGDYLSATIRLATLSHDANNHLLFASVELLPAEIVSPPRKAVMSPCGDDRLYFTRTPVSLDEGLAWYDLAWEGVIRSPEAPVSVASAPLSPEPPVPRFSLGRDAPFSPDWHGMPRLHRLVPMTSLDDRVARLAEEMVETSRYRRARAWLDEQLNFDLLAYDDWLGSVVLVVPNPVCRFPRLSLRGRTATDETVEFSGRLTRDVAPGDLTAIVQEVRADIPGFSACIPLDVSGGATAIIPGGVESVGVQLYSKSRGLLHDEAPGYFFRSVQIGSASPTKQRVTLPIRRRSSEEAVRHTAQVRAPTPQLPNRPPTAVERLARLRSAREERSGDRAPLLGHDRRSAAYRLFDDQRNEAVSYLRGLIARARTRVMLVDPYLEAIDLEEFGTATEEQGVRIEAVTESRAAYMAAAPDDQPGEPRGDLFVEQIERMREPESGFGMIDVRVLPAALLHDRFLVVDDAVWHLGHSFNGVGYGRLSCIAPLEPAADALQVLEPLFQSAEPFEKWWSGVPVPQPAGLFDRLIARARQTSAWIGNIASRPARRGRR